MEQLKGSRLSMRLLALILSAVMLLTALPVLSVQAESLTAWTTADVNLRSGAGTSNGVIKIVGEGTQITVIDTSDSGWYQVQLSDGTTGYMSAEYIRTGSSGSGQYTAKTTVVVNLRTGPGTNYGVITVLGTGVSVSVLDTSNSGWHKVRTSGGSEGYISSQYLRQDGGSSGGSAGGSDTESYTAQTTADVNFRNAPAGGIITVLGTGTKVTVINTSNGDWHKVRLASGSEGYISSQYLKKDEGSVSDPKPPEPVPGDAYDAQTTVDVNIRKTPGGTVITVLGTGTKVTVLDTSNSEWHKVRLVSGTEGYISSQYLKKVGGGSASDPTPVPVPGESFQAETTAGVNFRRGPSTNDSVIAVLGTGTAVTVIDTSNSAWYKVRTASGSEGYISSEFLKKTGDTSAPSDPTPGSYEAEATVDVNVRRGPGTGNGVITVIGTGTKVTVLDTGNSEWHKVRLASGVEGYISSEFLRKLGDGGTAPTPTPPATTDTYLKVDATGGLRLRSEPNTSSSAIVVLSDGQIVTLLEKTNSEWSKVRTDSGLEGYVFSEYTKPYTPGSAAGSANISASSANVAKYRTLYLKGSVNNGNPLVWTSDNESVALVNNGFVYGVSEGTATITMRDKFGSAFATCTVTVTGSEAMRYAVPETSAPAADTPFNFMAITGMDKSEVRFDVSNGQSVSTTAYTTESRSTAGLPTNETKVWKASISLPAGTYTVKAYADGSSDYKEFRVIVGAGTGASNAERQASSEAIKIIAQFEGFLPTVYPDTLAYNIPTVGYGLVINPNETFYNNLTDTEGFAQLLTSVNTSSYYAKSVNNFVKDKGLYLNQAQFDALVSFTYNCGNGWMYNSGYGFYKAIVNNFRSPDFQPSDSVIKNVALNMMEWHQAGGSCIAGLLWRRLAEAKLFLYGNYAECYHSHPNYEDNTYGFIYPGCMSGYQ